MLSIGIGMIIFTFSLVDIFCYYKIYTKIKKIEKQIATQTKSTGEDEESKPKTPSTQIRFHVVFIETTNFSLRFHLASTRKRS